MPVGAVSQGHLPFVLVPTFLGGGGIQNSQSCERSGAVSVD